MVLKNNEGSYKISLEVPRSLKDASQTRWGRKRFFSWVWESFQTESLVGVHEGSVVKNDLTFEPWVLDSAEPPLGRDWVSEQEVQKAEFYFLAEDGAKVFRRRLKERFPGLAKTLSETAFEKNQDWDREWKKSFQGIDVTPGFRVIPPWVNRDAKNDCLEIVINPGSAFGTGTHETTQLCLGVLMDLAKRSVATSNAAFSKARILDFGSGSGILGIAAARLGAGSVTAVEVDELAHDNFLQNVELNTVKNIQLKSQLDGSDGKFDVIVANVLRDVLLEVADVLVGVFEKQGVLVLSGLLEKDLPAIEEKYLPLLQKHSRVVKLKRYQKGDWFAVVFLGFSEHV